MSKKVVFITFVLLLAVSNAKAVDQSQDFKIDVYADNGLYEKYKKLSEIGIVAADIPVRLSGKKIVYTSENFTQSGVQLLKFTPAQEKREKR
ncbi:MAG: hypothetical protein KAR47_21495 [Planctomycetes bacterium]|nr:hypothetical protein [Planctomycetota bacterium]